MCLMTVKFLGGRRTRWGKTRPLRAVRHTKDELDNFLEARLFRSTLGA